jgi:hypothetical protein
MLFRSIVRGFFWTCIACVIGLIQFFIVLVIYSLSNGITISLSDFTHEGFFLFFAVILMLTVCLDYHFHLQQISFVLNVAMTTIPVCTIIYVTITYVMIYLFKQGHLNFTLNYYTINLGQNVLFWSGIIYSFIGKAIIFYHHLNNLPLNE